MKQSIMLYTRPLHGEGNIARDKSGKLKCSSTTNEEWALRALVRKYYGNFVDAVRDTYVSATLGKRIYSVWTVTYETLTKGAES
jgi:hypothetical protein